MPSPQDSSSTTGNSTGPPSVVSPPAGNTASSDSGSALTESTRGSGGRGAGRGGRGYGRYRGRGRGRGQGYQTAKHKGNRAPTPETKFKGETEDMNGHVFQTTAERKNNQQFERTLEALQAYAFKNLDNANDIMPILRNLKDENIPEPEDISDEDAKSKLKQRVWEKSVDKYVDRVGKLTQNVATMYSVAWGQCSKQMQSRVQASKEFKKNHEISNCLWLLKEIKGITFQFEVSRNIFVAIDVAKENVYAYRQKSHQSLADYYKEFCSMVDVLEHYGGRFGDDDALTAKVMEELRIDSEVEKKKFEADSIIMARQRALAIAFIRRADQDRFGNLLTDLLNQDALGNDQFPRTLADAYAALTNYTKPKHRSASTHTPAAKEKETPVTPRVSQVDDEQLNVSFMMVAGSDGRTYERVVCFNCNQPGHYASQCPKATTVVEEPAPAPAPPPANPPARPAPVTLAQLDLGTTGNTNGDVEPMSFVQVSLAQKNQSHMINPNWILLDSESSISVFRNPKLLTNIRRTTDGVRVYTNGGYQDSTMHGDIPNFGTVWFNPASMANILSLAHVTSVCRVTMDSDVENALLLHRKDGSIMKFSEMSSGLYYYDATRKRNSNSNESLTNYTFLNTVHNNKKNFTRREIQGADNARELMRKIGRPSQATFETVLSQNQIINCPVTVADAKRAAFIYGPDLASVKGKRVRKPPKHVPVVVLIPLPSSIAKFHSTVTLCVDFFFVNGNPFFHSIGRNIKFRTVHPTQNRKKPTILTCLEDITSIYNRRGFTITNLHGDGEFDCIRMNVGNIHVHIAAPGEHVPEVERSIRTTKERVRATVQGLPYRYIPKIMIKGMVRDSTIQLNAFPPSDGISTTMSPRTIVTGLPNIDYNKLKIRTGLYAQVHINASITNTPKARTVGAIALYQADENGSWYFMSLETGERLHSNNWIEAPISDDVIRRVNELGLQEGQTDMRRDGPVFEWGPNEPMEDEEDDAEQPWNDDDDNDHDPNNDPNDEPVDHDMNQNPGYVEEDVEALTHDEHEQDDNVEAQEREEPAPTENQERDPIDEETIENETSDNDEPVENRSAQNHDEHGENTEETDDNDATSNNNDTPSEGVNVGGHNLRGSRDRNYDHRFTFLQATAKIIDAGLDPTDEVLAGCHKEIANVCFTQMTANAGIKQFGQRAIDAIFAEFSQLFDLNVFGAIDASTLTTQQKRDALRAITLIKEKRCGKINSDFAHQVAIFRDQY